MDPKCVLMKLSGENWEKVEEFEAGPNESCMFYGLEITRDAVYMGGDDYVNNSNNLTRKSYLYITPR